MSLTTQHNLVKTNRHVSSKFHRSRRWRCSAQFDIRLFDSSLALSSEQSDCRSPLDDVNQCERGHRDNNNATRTFWEDLAYLVIAVAVAGTKFTGVANPAGVNGLPYTNWRPLYGDKMCVGPLKKMCHWGPLSALGTWQVSPVNEIRLFLISSHLISSVDHYL